MPKRFVKKSIKALVIIGLFLLLVALGGYLLFNNFYLPRYGKKFFIAQAEKLLDRKVMIDSLSWSLRRGFVVENITVKNRSREERLFGARSATIRYSMRSLIRKNFLIHSITIEGPRIFLERDASGVWNIEDILRQEKGKRTRFEFGEIEVKDAGISVNDEKEMFGDLKISGFNITAGKKTAGGYLFYSSGISSWDRARVSFNGESMADGSLPQFCLKSDDLRVDLYMSRLFPKFPVKFNDSPVNLRCDFKIDRGEVDARIRMSATDLTVSQKDWLYSGGVAGVGAVRMKLSEPDNVVYDARISVSSGRFRLENLDREFDECRGRLELENDSLSADKLHAHWKDCGITTDFVITELDTGFLELHCEVEGPAAQLKTFSDSVNRFLAKIDFTGSAGVVADLKGPLDREPDIEATVTLNKTGIKASLLEQPVENAVGEIYYHADHLDFKQVEGNYRGADFGMKAEVDLDQENIRIDAVIESGGLKLISKGNFQNRTPTACDLDIGIEGESADIGSFLPSSFDGTFSKLQPKGNVTTNLRIVGSPDDPRSLEIRGKTTSERVVFRRVLFENLDCSIFLSDGVFKLYDVSAVVLEGQGDLAGEVDFSETVATYKIEAHMQDVDIKTLPEALFDAERDIEGKFSLETILNGVINDSSALRGVANVRIKEGNLWEIEVFDALFNVLKLKIPIIGRVTFTKIKGSFEIMNNNILTRDLYFSSPTLRLMTIGKAGFDGVLKFDIDPKFMRPRGGLIGEGAVYIINLPSNIIPRLYLRGTITEPDFRWHFLPRVPILDDIFRRKPI